MAEKKTVKKKKSLKKDFEKSDNNIFAMVKQGMKSPQLPVIAGILLFLFAVFVLISFISYYNVWFEDYTLLENVSLSDVFHHKQDIHNWGGYLGGFLSAALVMKTFGIASVGLIFLTGLIALRLCKVKIKNFSKIFIPVLVIMLWVSCIIGFVVVCLKVDRLENLAGIVGIGVNELIYAVAKVPGCVIIHLAFTIIIPMLLFDVKYLWVRKQFKNLIDKTNYSEVEKEYNTTPATEIERNDSSEKIKHSGDIKTPETKSETEELNNTEQSNIQTAVTNNNTDSLTSAHDLVVKTSEKENLPQPDFVIKNLNEEENIEAEEKNSFDSIDDNIGQNNTEDSIQVPFVVKNSQQNTEDNRQETENSDNDIPHYTINDPYDPYAELSNYQFPPLDFLIDYEKNNSVTTERELVANKNRIVQTLLNYKIEISSIEATVGPTVTLYEIVPAPGIRISKIKSLEDDIALSLSALGIRIIAPIPGKGTIGIEVPNSKAQIVSMKSMLESPQFTDNKFELPIVIGRRIDNTPYACDLAKMPHLLMAGATGQGKSVGLNAIISSLLFKKHPCDLKFIFVDPKKVELSLYSKLEKHYLAKVPNGQEPVITDTKDVVYTLRSLCQLMDTRYELLKDAGCKKITEYNKKFISRRLNPERGHEYMPYIVVVIDEFADLIMTSGKEIEKPICRLAQLARAVGIHLIIATQRPSVNIITGTIKANFPARAAFKVSSLTDSRTILDTKGAEQLIGRGDMLISNGGPLVRLQCALIDTDEIEKIAYFIGEQQGFTECFMLPEVKETEEDDGGEKKNFDDGKLDSKFEEAARLIVMTQQGSTSMLQRKLALGYNRAGRVMDQLESAGIVGPFRGAKARDVLVTSEEELDEILNNIRNKNR